MIPTKRSSWLPSIFNDFFGNEWVEKTTAAGPAVNIIENDRQYRVEIAGPGLTRDDYRIDILDNNQLVVSMEKTEQQSDKDDNGKYLRREFSYGHFKQSMILPDDTDEDLIEAKVENGVLTIDIPKKNKHHDPIPKKEIDIK